MLVIKNKFILTAVLSVIAAQAVADTGSVAAASSASVAATLPVVPDPAKQAAAVLAQVAPQVTVMPNEVSGIVVDKPHVKKRKRNSVVPGLGHVFVDDKLTRSNVVHISRDGTEIALISSKFPNRISTPYEHPRIIDESTVTYTTDGSDIYLVDHVEKPLAIFIKGDPDDPVASITLMPRDIPSQTIILQMDEKNATRAVREAKVDTYEQQVTDLLRTVVSGRVPEGFSEGRMASILGQKGDLSIIPEVRYSGAYLDIYRYRVENNGSQVELSESAFYQKGVRAASIFPRAVLKRGDNTWIYLIADKSVLDGNGNGN